MSKDQTTQPAQRMRLSLSSGPNPPWTGQVFACEDFGATFQLCASDELKPHVGTFGFLAPPCWTCGHINIVFPPRLDPGSRNPNPAS